MSQPVRPAFARRFVSSIALVLALSGCSEDSSGPPSDAPDMRLDAGDAASDAGDALTDAALSDTGSLGSDLADMPTPQPGWRVLFQDGFDGLGPPYVDGYDRPPAALPLALFPQDESRWTQLQNTHPGTNWVAYDEAQGAVRFFASGQPQGVASKMGFGRGVGLQLRAGEVVRLGADFYIEAGADGLPSNTLIDLEDTDDLTLTENMVETQPGAGLRLRINENGHLALDRGELMGSDAGEPAHFRLSSMTSDYSIPADTWVRVEVVLKLGVGVARSTDGPIDRAFDGDQTPAWCEIWVTVRGGEPEQVLRQKGTTFLDRAVGLPLLMQASPGAEVSWPQDLDYNSFQVGLTNNRSTKDQRLLVDRVVVERLDGGL